MRIHRNSPSGGSATPTEAALGGAARDQRGSGEGRGGHERCWASAASEGARAVRTPWPAHPPKECWCSSKDAPHVRASVADAHMVDITWPVPVRSCVMHVECHVCVHCTHPVCHPACFTLTAQHSTHIGNTTVSCRSRHTRWPDRFRRLGCTVVQDDSDA